MSIFEEVKSHINMLDAAKYYGAKVGGSGLTNCIFHNDKHPSMKLYNDHFHCFACGAHGDVIAFAAQLFNLPPYEAAKKLADDFGIKSDYVPPRKRQSNDRSGHDVRKLLTDYIAVLKRNRDIYRPCSPDEELHPLYTEAVQNLPLYEYYLDCISDEDELKNFIKNERRMIYELKQKLQQTDMAHGKGQNQ